MERLRRNKNIRTFERKISSSESDESTMERPRGLSPIRLKKVNGVLAPISNIPYKSLHKDVEFDKKHGDHVKRGTGSEVFLLFKIVFFLF